MIKDNDCMQLVTYEVESKSITEKTHTAAPMFFIPRSSRCDLYISKLVGFTAKTARVLGARSGGCDS